MTRIWLDDTLPPPDSSYDAWCKSATGAIAVLRLCRVTYISFDVDLGYGGSGIDVAWWLFANAAHITPPDYDIHSSHQDAQTISEIMDIARQEYESFLARAGSREELEQMRADAKRFAAYCMVADEAQGGAE